MLLKLSNFQILKNPKILNKKFYFILLTMVLSLFLLYKTSYFQDEFQIVSQTPSIKKYPTK
jgi:hypothetical protein